MLCCLSAFRGPAELRDSPGFSTLDNSLLALILSFHMGAERVLCGWWSGIPAGASRQMDGSSRQSAPVLHTTRTPGIHSSLHHTFLSALNLCPHSNYSFFFSSLNQNNTKKKETIRRKRSSSAIRDVTGSDASLPSRSQDSENVKSVIKILW